MLREVDGEIGKMSRSRVSLWCQIREIKPLVLSGTATNSNDRCASMPQPRDFQNSCSKDLDRLYRQFRPKAIIAADYPLHKATLRAQ